MFSKLANKVSKLANNLDLMGRVLIVISIVILILLSFYWGLGLRALEIKSIYTLDTGLVPISVAPEYVFALLAIFLFYVGYRLYFRREPHRKVGAMNIETEKELMIKYVLSIMLGGIGAWLIFNEFSNAGIWSYYIPHYVQISTGSFALRVIAVIALLLLLIWFLIIKIRIRLPYQKESGE